MFKSKDLEKNRMAIETMKTPIRLDVITGKKEDRQGLDRKIDVKGVIHADGVELGKTPVLDRFQIWRAFKTGYNMFSGKGGTDKVIDTKLDFSTEQTTKRSMDILSRGIDIDSDLAKYLIGNGVKFERAE